MNNYRNLSVRVDENVKKEFENVLFDLGMNSSTAINIFMRMVIKENGLPFPVTASVKQDLTDGKDAIKAMRQRSKDNGIADMSMDDIDSVIAEVRNEKRHGS